MKKENEELRKMFIDVLESSIQLEAKLGKLTMKLRRLEKFSHGNTASGILQAHQINGLALMAMFEQKESMTILLNNAYHRGYGAYWRGVKEPYKDFLEWMEKGQLFSDQNEEIQIDEDTTTHVDCTDGNCESTSKSGSAS